MKIEMKICCEKCGKEKEIDYEKTTKNWKVYKDTFGNFEEECECGGKFKLVVLQG